MSLHLLGISHHTAPLEQREPLALSEDALPRALALLREQPDVREGWILSTCNRVEVMVASPTGALPGLLAFLAAASGQPHLPPLEGFYQLRGEAVVRHVFRVAASLDSLVVGEPQILGQLKAAYAAAQSAGAAGAELDAMASRAFRAAKRVRTETNIGAQAVGVSQAAVELARQIFGDLHQKTVLLLGAGLMGTAAARYLRRDGSVRLLVVNRTLAHARELALKAGGEAYSLEQLPELGGLADIVLACTGAPHPLITRAQAAQFLAHRRGRPMLFLDLAVPRDIEPSVHQLENAFVYNVDDLDQVVSSNRSERRLEAERGEKIIDEEVRSYMRRQQSLELVPTLCALQEHAESLRAAEWERLSKHLGPLSAEQARAVEAFSRSLMQKWLHRPLVQLRQAVEQDWESGAGDRRAFLDFAHRLFGLPAPRSEEGAPAEPVRVPEGEPAGKGQ
ncbi:MAG: glutamyl-tRNA reductase [Terriglobales bacterium]